MPELPEVEVVRRGLAGHVLGQRVSEVEVRHPRAVRRHLGGPDDLVARLLGRTFTAVGRRGKYLWVELDDGDSALLGHLGMSGQLLIRPPGAPDETHLRVRIRFADEPSELRFVDQRTFGGLSVERLEPVGGELLPGPVLHIARDPLDPAFEADDVVAALRRRRTGLKRALLDQTLVSGIGNIYADEALWVARLHPARPTTRLTRAQGRLVLASAGDRDGAGAGRGRHLVRRAVRERQRPVRLLRPLARGLRAGGPAVPALRHPDPAGGVHEPLVLLLPALPAPPAPPTPLTGVLRTPPDRPAHTAASRHSSQDMCAATSRYVPRPDEPRPGPRSAQKPKSWVQ